MIVLERKAMVDPLFLEKEKVDVIFYPINWQAFVKRLPNIYISKNQVYKYLNAIA